MATFSRKSFPARKKGGKVVPARKEQPSEETTQAPGDQGSAAADPGADAGAAPDQGAESQDQAAAEVVAGDEALPVEEATGEKDQCGCPVGKHPLWAEMVECQRRKRQEAEREARAAAAQ